MLEFIGGAPRAPRRGLRLRQAPAQMRGIGGGFSALIVGARGPDAYSQGMAGMGGVVEDLVNKSTGGALAGVQVQLGQVEFALKISTAAAIGGALVAVIAAVISTRRR